VKLITESKGDLSKGETYTMVKEPEPISLLTRETEPYTDASGRNRQRPTGRTHWIDDVIHMNHFAPVIMAKVPKVYYFPAELQGVAAKLREHGIEVGTVAKRLRTDVQEFTITKYTRATRAAYGDHRTVSVEGTYAGKTATITAGSFMVDMKQPLAWLIFYLLEPQSDDGLLFWNYFDDYLLPKGAETKSLAFPVVKGL
jgi:dipeptidyl-peptidase-4